MIKIYSEYEFGDITVRYLLDRETKSAGFYFLPTSTCHKVCQHRKDLSAVRELTEVSKHLPVSMQPWRVQPLVELSLAGDIKAQNLGQGETLRKGSASCSMQFIKQREHESGGKFTIETECFSDEYDLRVNHYLQWDGINPFFSTWSKIENISKKAVGIELLTSVNVGHLTPFDPADAPNRLYLHRLRSSWSFEGRHEIQSIEELGLERAWVEHPLCSERFGMTGTKPTKRWFPMMALEDREAGVFWGVQLAWAGSWQMEIFRQDDFVGFSASIADREHGHWLKHLAPNKSLKTPVTYLSTSDKGFDDLTTRLTSHQKNAATKQPSVEETLPIAINEWCTSWGHPTHDSLINLANTASDLGCKYLIIDAGWYADETGEWDNSQGDWIPSKKFFPHGLKETCKKIREQGIIPGLWFEFEIAGKHSSLWNRTDLLLHRDGVPVQVGNRRFLDMRKPECHNYLESRVLDLIEECKIGYIKVDYNETVGIGVDGTESLGEGLRQHVLGIYRFFDHMKERFPNLVIENCASGSQRMESSMIQRCAMTSFSDAHETLSIPIIAANLKSMTLPRLLQIWAVLRRSDSEQRLAYSLSATFLGRMCLSGDLPELNKNQRAVIKSAIKFYQDVSDIIKDGSSLRYGPPVHSYNKPTGWQAVVRYSDSKKRALIVIHGFADTPKNISIPLQKSYYTTTKTFAISETQIHIGKEALVINELSSFSGCAIELSTTGKC